MSYIDHKITEEMLDDKGVVGLPNTPQMSAIDLQKKFDEIATDVIIPQFNDLCDALDVGGGESDTRITELEDRIDTLEDTTIPNINQAITDCESDANDYTDEQIATIPDWAKAESKPTYTAAEVGALPSSTSIPSKTSDLTNDSGFITSATIPTKTSQLTNDSGFLTEHQDISGKQDKLTAGEHITINGNVISAEATTVSVNPIRTSGAHIADITVDGTAYELYAPNDGGGGGGTTDYSDLTSKPSINSVELIGNKTLSDLGIASASDLSDLSDIVGQVNTLLEGV